MFDVIKRQPALVLSLIEAVLGFIVTLGWSGLSADQSAAIVAAIVAAGGLAVGGLSRDVWIGRLTGFVKAALIVGIAYGANVPQESQAALLAVVSAAGMVFIWDRNTPKVNVGK
jgi:peptidoglycan/LPS O-acetylase OafA/YrhL